MAIKSIRWAQGEDPSKIAQEFVAFVGAAKKTLDIAIYDFRLTGAEKTEIVAAIKKAAHQCKLRIAYDHTKQETTPTLGKASLGSDPAPRGTQQFVLEAFGDEPKVHTQAVAGSHLMHSKYMIRDKEDVWMGSANFTDDAWSNQENNLIQIRSKELALHYETDFGELFTTGNIKATGKNDFGIVTVDGKKVEFGFAPGSGSAIASLFVDAIHGAGARGKVRLATMVLSSGPILGALVDHMRAGGEITGVYDATQMAGVETSWKKSATSAPKLAAWQLVKPHLVGKHSTPFSDTSVHDFMHNKVLVTPHTVLTGSFNLSRNAESNAENALSIHDTDLAHQYSAYIQSLVERYSSHTGH